MHSRPVSRARSNAPRIPRSTPPRGRQYAWGGPARTDMSFAAGLPEPVRALLSLIAILLVIVPLCMAFGSLLGAVFARHRRYESAIAFGGTLVATVVATFLLLAATQSSGAFIPLLFGGLALPGAACWWLNRWAAKP